MKTSLTLIILCIVFTGSFAQKIFSDQDNHVDFTRYSTYAWLPPVDTANDDTRGKPFAGAVRYFANEELKKRGMRLDTLNPQALFIFGSKVENHVKYSQTAQLSVGVGVAGPGYYVGGSAPVAGGKIIETAYREGTLIYAMHDVQTGKLLWQGGMEKSFDNPDITKLIADGAKRIFKKFPRKVEKSKKK